jgi:ABC-type sugar transport system permease subunit
MGKRDGLNAYLFLAPFLAIFVAFLAFPVFYSFYLSLHQVPKDSYDVFSGLQFVGFSNFIKLFQDVRFLWSLLISAYYAAMVVPLGIAGSLLLALLLNAVKRVTYLFKTAYFLPYVLDMLVVGIVWTLILSPYSGVLVRFLERLGIGFFTEKGFLGMPATAMPSVAAVNLLKGAGFGMILYLAAIQNIPRSLYEAASVDGAGTFAKLRFVTLPMVKPVTLFMAVVGTIAALNAFVEVYAMTGGGPNVDVGGRALGATWVTGYYLYDTFYERWKLGYAASMSYILLAATILLSLVQAKFLRSED